MWPEIKDFSKPQTKFLRKNVNEISYKDWLWFHPSAFQLIRHGSLWIGIIVQLFMILLCILYRFYLPIIFCIVVICVLGYAVRNQIKTWDLYKDWTLFDLLIRDFEGEKEDE